MWMEPTRRPIVPRVWSQYTLCDMPPKGVAASKKEEFVWMDDEIKLLLIQVKQSGCDPFLLRVTQWPINHM